MESLRYLFVVLSALGLALSLFVHIASFLGLELPSVAMGLHVGIFVVWLPAVLVANKLATGVSRADYWRAVLRGCPKWMQYMVYGFSGYAVINFALFFLGTSQGEIDSTGSDSIPSSVFRGFSGHWMAFYSAALAILYSGIKVRLTRPRKCPAGHTVSLSAEYCEQCGLPIQEE